MRVEEFRDRIRGMDERELKALLEGEVRKLEGLGLTKVERFDGGVEVGRGEREERGGKGGGGGRIVS